MNMFNDSKYTKWYFSIVNNRKVNPILNSSYKEIHHIIPKKMGGSNDKENLIALTPREHFIVHLLLTKMTKGLDKKYMFHALNLMAYTRKVKLTSITYSYIKENYSKENSGYKNIIFGKIGENHPAFGYKHTQEHKKYISNKLKGRKHKEESIKKMSDKAKGRKISEETKNKISKANKGSNNFMFGRIHSIQTKQKMKNHHWSLKKEYNIWHILDTNNEENIFYQGSLYTLCKQLNTRASLLKKSLITKKPIKKGILKGLLLIDSYIF